MVSAKIFAAAAGIFSLAHGHMHLDSPSRFTGGAAPDNGPLDPSGSNFPCKGSAGATFSGPTTQFPIGSKQSVSFTGSAVHGGGSCQFSVTYDTNPTKNSKWKVMHSVVGGCPARNTPGNLGDNAGAANPDKYAFEVPSIPAGKATFAWSWNNKVGNREFYMECGSIELTGSGGSQSTFDALPDMLVANLAGVSSCTLDEGLDLLYPNPGSSVETNGGKPQAPKGNCGSSGGDGGVVSKPATTKPATTKPAPTATVPGGVFVEKPTGGASAPAVTAPASTRVPSPPAATPTRVASPPAATPTKGSGTGSSGVLTGPCPVEGTWNCIGGKSFQQCASGTWSAVISVAAGTTCDAGQSTNLKISAVGRKKRWARAFRA